MLDNLGIVDSCGRRVTYLRLSLTDRCDMRCTYCMHEKMTFLPPKELLSLEEMADLSRTFVRLGVRKIRLTGGEPLVRRDAVWLIKELGYMVKRGELNELCMTTNGQRLAECADEIAAAGMSRINLSLDSLDPDQFKQITRVGDLSQVLAGAQAAKEAGLPVKVNAVIRQGVNEDQVHDLVAWCGQMGFDLTFIEEMPLGDVNGGRETVFLSNGTLRQRIERRWTLEDSDYSTGGPSRYVHCRETGRKIGFITPLSDHFCETCNRVRLTCTGHLYTCLGHEDGADLRAVVRDATKTEADVVQAILHAIANKPKGHDFIIDDQAGPVLARHMSVTGG